MTTDEVTKLAISALETTEVPVRLWQNPDFQTWMEETVKPAIEGYKTVAASQDMSTDAGRRKAELAAVTYQSLKKLFIDNFVTAQKARQSAQDIVRPKTPPILSKRQY